MQKLDITLGRVNKRFSIVDACKIHIKEIIKVKKKKLVIQLTSPN